MTSSSVLKVALLALATVGPVIVLKDFTFLGSDLPEDRSSTQAKASYDSDKGSESNGGWRLPDADTLQRLGTSVCNIERISVTDLDTERFEKEFRFKKPVLVAFPNGAADWTDPHKWSQGDLRKTYGQWQTSSGSSVEIVRAGGNGDTRQSFIDFLDGLMRQTKPESAEAKFYLFDRDFYKESDLPSTLKLPPYFAVSDDLDDSIFFLGASGSGVVFHKHADTWNGVVFGNKRWFLYPISKTPPGGVYHGYTLLDWVERVYPNLEDKDKPLECVQRGGEILYLPEGYYHATLNLGDTIAVALQKKKAKMIAEKLSYEVTEMSKAPNQTEVNKKIVDNLTTLREILPGNTEVIMKLGEKYGDLGQHKQALELLQKTIELDPYFVLAYTVLGMNLAKLQRHDEAEVMFQRACELSPGLWDVHKEYGMFLLQRGKYAEAVPVFKRGTVLRPDLLPFWSYLKAAQTESGDVDGAKETQRTIEHLKATQR